MIKLWSELPRARARELVADVATALWVLFWGSLAWSLYQLLAGFAEAGRLVRGGGENLQSAGNALAGHLAGLPLVGEQVSGAARGGFDAAGAPIVDAGNELEAFVIVIAATLALILLLVPLIPWLSRYVPWRLERLHRTRAAHRAIRRAPTEATSAGIERVLAGRALNRLEWTTLLEYTPDPIGDWERGTFARLALAEYESAGLRPSRLPPGATPPAPGSPRA